MLESIPPLPCVRFEGGHATHFTRTEGGETSYVFDVQLDDARFAVLLDQRRAGENCRLEAYRLEGRRFQPVPVEFRPALERCVVCGASPQRLYKTVDNDAYRCRACMERALLPRLGDVLAVYASNADAWRALTGESPNIPRVVQPGEHAAMIAHRASLFLLSIRPDEEPITSFGNVLRERGHWLLTDSTLPLGKIWLARAYDQAERPANGQKSIKASLSR